MMDANRLTCRWLSLIKGRMVLLLPLTGLLVFLLYAGTLQGPFVFDDSRISDNPHIRLSSLSPASLLEVALNSEPASRPVANISFALNYYIHKYKVEGYRLVNILIHITAGIVLYYLIRITINVPAIGMRDEVRYWLPYATALIWLLHPLHTQSVSYIVQRMNSLASMFYVLALLCYAKGRLTKVQNKKAIFFIASMISGLFAFGSKETAATLPLFILLYEWYFFQDLRLKISWKPILSITAVVAVLFFYMFYLMGSSPIDYLLSGYDTRTFTLSQRLLTEPRVVLHYISLLIYPNPDRLNLDYDFQTSSSLFLPVTTIISVIIVFGLLVWAVYSARDKRLYSFCVLWFLGNLVIESTIIPLEIVYEHRTYLPSMLGILPLIMLFAGLIREKIKLVVCLVSVALVFSFWTYNRNKVWQNEIALLEDCQNKSPDKSRINLNLGKAYLDRDKIDEAILMLKRALNLYMREIQLRKKVDRRQTSFYYRNLGVAYRKKEDCQKAITYLNKAQMSFYFDAETHYELGYCYTAIWDLDKAVHHLSKAVQFAQHHKASLNMRTEVEEFKKSLEIAKHMQKVLRESQVDPDEKQIPVIN